MPKYDLIFRKPVLNAAGFLGFTPDPRAAIAWDEFGAFITNPISLRSRQPAASPELLPYQGGFLLHNGLPNPGLSAVLNKYSRHWADASLPIIPHLMADRPEGTAQMLRRLEGMENIAAIELGFAPQDSNDTILTVVQMCLGELPLIVNLTFEQVLSLGPKLIRLGAAALSLSAPRGALPVRGGALVSGRLYGPALLPQSLALVRDAARLGLPVIGGAGLYNKADALAMLENGALAIQLDAVLWKNGGLN
jgi:dihydroorotate dehydrogenase